ncbi:MAG TPA: hypothetical protein VFE68_02990, partial [Vicinamibacteria bacterium]|nr:hypothetical protein [Vicinamibacteria bacterium]
MSLRPADARVLDAWAVLLRETGALARDAPLPVHPVAAPHPLCLGEDVAAYVDGDAVVGLSARRAGLETLPPSMVELVDLEVL